MKGYFVRPLTEGRHDQDTILARVAAARACGGDPSRLTTLDAAVARWEVAEDDVARQRASEMVHILCRAVEASARPAPSVPFKTNCGCAMRHVCKCLDPDCTNGWLIEDRDGREVSVRCPACPGVVKDAPLDPWA